MADRFSKLVVHTVLVLCMSVSFANADIIVGKRDLSGPASVLSGSVDSMYSGEKTPLDSWHDWLESKKLNDGVNERKGKFFVISMARANVSKPSSAKSWINSRNFAYERAHLNAKTNLAKEIRTLIETGRGLSLFEQADNPPPNIKEAVEKLSVMDKALALTDKALDQEIKKYDPNWDGTGRSKEEREQKRIVLKESFYKNIAAQAQRFVSGALVAKIIEGTNAQGFYEVLVGIAWSPSLGKIARAMYDEGYTIALTKPDRPIRKQIREMIEKRPGLLATTVGVYKRKNEKGETVLISFSAVPLSRSRALNENKARLFASSYISEFISESVVSNAKTSGGEIFQEYKDGTTAVFDNSKYQEDITSQSKKVSVAGLTSLFQWEGKHPHSQQDIYVGLYVWSPSTQAVAQQLEMISIDQEEDMKSVGKDGVKRQSGSNENSAADPAASGVNEGFESDTDF